MATCAPWSSGSSNSDTLDGSTAPPATPPASTSTGSASPAPAGCAARRALPPRPPRVMRGRLRPCVALASAEGSMLCCTNARSCFCVSSIWCRRSPISLCSSWERKCSSRRRMISRIIIRRSRSRIASVSGPMALVSCSVPSSAAPLAAAGHAADCAARCSCSLAIFFWWRLASWRLRCFSRSGRPCSKFATPNSILSLCSLRKP
mmetsp:Transcript_5124/g.17884  ORF Transcript_5124/g.17884 Transcript_5124/m.17884 type:complete len:205 (+) Transcript_5124:499-1113(+)